MLQKKNFLLTLHSGFFFREKQEKKYCLKRAEELLSSSEGSNNSRESLRETDVEMNNIDKIYYFMPINASIHTSLNFVCVLP